MAKQLLVYIENSRCIVFGSNMQEMQQVDFPFDIARDLEILNKDSMHTLIQTAIDTYQIFPAIVMFILSPLITFDKDLSDIPPEQQEPEAQKFLDQVPFQNVLSYRFATQKKQKIIAANKDFVLTMKTAFEKRTFPVTAVVPLVAVQEIMPELIENLDLTLLLAKIET